MSRKKNFEYWLTTKRGRDVFNALCSHVKLGNEKYVKNCLWWAYYAGTSSDDVWPGPITELLQDVYRQRKKLNKNIEKRLEEIFDSEGIELM